MRYPRTRRFNGKSYVLNDLNYSLKEKNRVKKMFITKFGYKVRVIKLKPKNKNEPKYAVYTYNPKRRK